MPSRQTTSSRRISVTNLEPASFAPFGEVIQNPTALSNEPALQTIEANQGTATKWLDVSHMENFYHRSRSGTPGKCIMNMFVCRARELREGRLFTIGILERHPFTPQTFVPMGLSRKDGDTAYLVVVAPTLPTVDDPPPRALTDAYSANVMLSMDQEEGRRSGQQNMRSRPHPRMEDPDKPDLANLRAFIARGDQAVTYGAGTWHAPMVVLGKGEIEFVVVQYANGVAQEDCQEVEIAVEDGGEGVTVDIGSSADENKGAARARL